MMKKTGKQWMGLSLSTISALVLILGFAGIGMARYVMEKNKAEIAAADNFYFTSNLLKEDLAENVIYYVDPSKDTFTIELYNYEDEQRKTASEINYTAVVENGTSNPASGSISTDSGKAVVEITPTNKNADIIVTVTSTNPYKKVLNATFKMSLGNQYTIDNSGSTAAVLTMTFTDSGGDITLNLPDNIIPDENNAYVSKNANSWQFKAPQDGIYSLILLKQQDMVLTGSGAFADTITLTAEN